VTQRHPPVSRLVSRRTSLRTSLWILDGLAGSVKDFFWRAFMPPFDSVVWYDNDWI